jgi:hypothetical protein
VHRAGGTGREVAFPPPGPAVRERLVRARAICSRHPVSIHGRARVGRTDSSSVEPTDRAGKRRYYRPLLLLGWFIAVRHVGVGPAPDVDPVVFEDISPEQHRVVHMRAVLDAGGDGVLGATDTDDDVDDRP